MKAVQSVPHKKIGHDEWDEKEAEQIRKKYFTGQFVVYKGQAD